MNKSFVDAVKHINEAEGVNVKAWVLGFNH